MTPTRPEATLTEESLGYAALDWADPGLLMTIVRDVSDVSDPVTLRDISIGQVIGEVSWDVEREET